MSLTTSGTVHHRRMLGLLDSPSAAPPSPCIVLIDGMAENALFVLDSEHSQTHATWQYVYVGCSGCL